jgi:hypothetical protein
MENQGPKGFFMTIFSSVKDRKRIFEVGPYLFNSTILHIRCWMKHFMPKKENFKEAPIWISMYSLPQEFSEKETHEGIKISLGSFIEISKVTKQGIYTSYARIFVYDQFSILLYSQVPNGYRYIQNYSNSKTLRSPANLQFSLTANFSLYSSSLF